jgi:hypothetical protein
MKNIGSKQRKTANGYRQKLKMYQAANCQNCLMRAGCHKGKGNRIIQVNQRLRAHRQRAKELLENEIRVVKRRERGKVEAVFGHIKHNKGFKRLNLRGLKKAEIEVGLIAIAHNLNHFGLARGH